MHFKDLHITHYYTTFQKVSYMSGTSMVLTVLVYFHFQKVKISKKACLPVEYCSTDFKQKKYNKFILRTNLSSVV